MKGAKLRKPARRKTSPVRLQYGALPYRFAQSGALEILLITTRRSKRWIIPKGDPIKGLRPAKSAAREAFEEAGVRGAVAERSLGIFRFQKTLEGAPNILCEVKVFALNVKTQVGHWPEAAQREWRWFEPNDALAAVNDAELHFLIGRFAKKMSPKPAVSPKALILAELGSDRAG